MRSFRRLSGRIAAAVVTLALLVTTLGGCVIVGFTTAQPQVVGEGEVQTFTYNIREFDHIDVRGDFFIVINNVGDEGEFGVSIDMERNLSRHVSVSVRGRTLRISSGGYRLYSSDANWWLVRVTITVPVEHEFSANIIHGWGDFAYYNDCQFMEHEDCLICDYNWRGRVAYRPDDDADEEDE
jgi:hypothetical protein